MPVLASLAFWVATAQLEMVKDNKTFKLSPDGLKLLVDIKNPKTGSINRQVKVIETAKIIYSHVIRVARTNTYCHTETDYSAYWASDSESFYEVETRPVREQSIKISEISLARPQDPIEYANVAIKGFTRPKLWFHGDVATMTDRYCNRKQVRFYQWSLKDPSTKREWAIQAPQGFTFRGYESDMSGTWYWTVARISDRKLVKNPPFSCTSGPFGIGFSVIYNQPPLKAWK